MNWCSKTFQNLPVFQTFQSWNKAVYIMDMSNFETKENNRLRLWDWRKRLDDVDKFSLFPRSFSVSFEFSSIFISLSVAESRMMRLRTLPNHCSLQVLIVEKRKIYVRYQQSFLNFKTVLYFLNMDNIKKDT